MSGLSLPNRWAGVPTLRAAAVRLWYGVNPELRRSRFHTQKGRFVLRTRQEAADFGGALITGLAWKAAGWRPVLPWITFPAMRFLRSSLAANSRVFEWGAGMSTLWFERRCAEVHVVDDDAAWCGLVGSQARKAHVYLLGGRAYAEKIREFPTDYFDLISIDGSHRLACFREALAHIGQAGMVLVDNTDSDRTTKGDLFVVDEVLGEFGAGWEVRRFPGWGPCNFFSWETTVCIRR